MVCFRFVPDKGFEGAERGMRRDGPVQFERDEDEDPFGLNKFLKDAKEAKKRPVEESRSRDYKKSRRD